MEYFLCSPLYFCKLRKVNTRAVKILSIEFANVKMQISHYGLCEPTCASIQKLSLMVKQVNTTISSKAQHYTSCLKKPNNL